jgi:hypothetical protein
VAGVTRGVEHRHEAAEGVPVHDRARDPDCVTEVSDCVGTELEAPRRRVAPVGTPVSGQVEVDDLRDFREPGEGGLEVGVVEAPGPAVQEHDGGPLAHLRALSDEGGAIDIEPESGPIYRDTHRPRSIAEWSRGAVPRAPLRLLSRR